MICDTQSPLNMRYGGISRLLTPTAFNRLQKSHVLIIGIGGVGSWCVEALARSGVGNLTIVDLDEVCITNTNRQLHALNSTIGMSKVEVMQKRLHDATPDCHVRVIADFFDNKTKEAILDGPYDLVIDCIDSVSNKCLLLDECRKRKIPVITVGGAGGKSDPTQIKTSDLGLSTNDTLLKRVRKSLKREWDWPNSEGEVWGVQAVYSIERSKYLDENGQLQFVPNPRQRNRIDCSTGIGTATWITGSFGFFAAAIAVDQLVKRVH